ncbi:hypothetical protein F4820DRAFT_428813 [Hypoxylon rubiginosum]|uniref:Uncharacterized protein n=1 Tax=Hypoxylon rubiginosum TaxID=110542 RepID=A0ACB9YVG9_9PEZI|nr:hypothetical protein F4820DRAFT_428813 [Hypoxylon rubiginosum]
MFTVAKPRMDLYVLVSDCFIVYLLWFTGLLRGLSLPIFCDSHSLFAAFGELYNTVKHDLNTQTYQHTYISTMLHIVYCMYVRAKRGSRERPKTDIEWTRGGVFNTYNHGCHIASVYVGMHV